MIYPYPVLTPDLVELSLWMARYYAASLGSVFETVVPSVIRQGKKEKIEKYFILSSNPQLTSPAAAGLHNTAVGDCPGVHGKQQKSLLDKILALPPQTAITFEMFHGWNISPTVAHSLVKKGVLRLVQNTVYRASSNTEHSDAEIVSSHPPELMPEQAAAVEAFSQLLREKSPKPQLLQGVTGSGKTEVYLRLISLALELGGSALMLVPEVALTPQMIGRLRGRFGNDPQHCVVWHSRLSAGERADAYRAIVAGKCRIVVGARSALFSPLKDLRLIILDEEHEMAYKQEESPRYHAGRPPSSARGSAGHFAFLARPPRRWSPSKASARAGWGSRS